MASLNSALRLCGFASLPGPPGLRDRSWCSMSFSPITQEDVAVWPCSGNILSELTAFLATLQSLRGAADSGKFCTSFLEFLVMFEQSAGHGLLC